jgi:hypothetical protein
MRELRDLIIGVKIMDNKKPWRNGGREKRAPYKTKIIRVPEDLIYTIKNNINQWHYNNFPEQFVEKHKLPLIELVYKYISTRPKKSIQTKELLRFIKWLDTQ